MLLLFSRIILIAIFVFFLLDLNWIVLYKDGFIKPYRKQFGINKYICYDLMNEVADVMDKYNIKFWLSEGTALGIYRDNDLIEYDDDVDFSFRGDINNQYDIFLNFVIPELKHKGYLCSKINNLYFAIKNGHFIDFDILIPGKICVAKGWGSSDIVIPYTEKLNQIQWKDRTWNIPTIKYFEFLYGKTWNIPIRNFKPKQ